MRLGLAECAALVLVVLQLGCRSGRTPESTTNRCGDGTLVGAYAFKYSGILYAPAGRLPNGDGAAVAGVGIVSFDGKGKVAFTGVNDYAGQNVPFPANTVGDYVAKSDCTGTIKVTLPPDVPDEIYFVVAEGGARLYGLFTVPRRFGEGSVVTLEFTRL